MMRSNYYHHICSICGADFTEDKNLKRIYSALKPGIIYYCTSCGYLLDTCILISACRISLEDIPLIICNLNKSDTFIVLKYRLEHHIESLASFIDYLSIEPEGKKFIEIKNFLSKVLNRNVILKKYDVGFNF